MLTLRGRGVESVVVVPVHEKRHVLVGYVGSEIRIKNGDVHVRIVYGKTVAVLDVRPNPDLVSYLVLRAVRQREIHGKERYGNVFLNPYFASVLLLRPPRLVHSLH